MWWWLTPMRAPCTAICWTILAVGVHYGASPGCSSLSPGSCSCWPSRGRTPGIRHHNVWFPADYDAEFDQLFAVAAQPVVDPTIYACVPDDDSMHPAGAESWFILVNAPAHNPPQMDWAQSGEQYADHVLAVLARRGVDLRERIRWRRIRTPKTLAEATASPGGSIYGMSSNGRLSTALRPANRSPVPGLFLVGGSAHPGGGLPLVGMGAEIVATEIGRA